ncbi:MAG: cyclic nucleotide-binding domain-containing protein [Leptonema illini]|uniref:Cyclic nucleotide-binding domain-containing protein n=1 Tax=Leptonema illini TaxID=183 RepID=A0A833LYW4_9LEPT|nr:MAG: cyclic nucleotide-binding domain-containing protein [Leptonema illini]
MKMASRSLREIPGGVLATLLGIPKSIALGIVALAPLGSAFTAVGPFAGLVSLAAGNLATPSRRGGSVVNSGPYSVSALMLASAATTFSLTHSPDVAFKLLLLVVLLSGVIQLLLGLLRFGTIAKYIPYPVFSGLMNGSAILILLPQVQPIFNATPALLLKEPSLLLSQTTLLSVAAATLTVLAYALTRHLNRPAVPPAFIAVIVGSLGFHAAAYLGSISVSELLVGGIPTGIPLPRLFASASEDLLSLQTWQTLALPVASFATSIALINSLSSFLAQSFSDTLCRERTDPNAELLNQGSANLLSALFGGLPAAGSSSRSKAAYDYGARTRTSRLAGGLFAVLVLIWAGPLFAPIPLSVMGGVLLILAYGLFDRWLLLQIVELMKQRDRREIATNIGISLLVTVVMVAVGMVEAVVTGVLLSVVIFVTTMSRGIIRREFSGLSMRSNTERPRRETDILDREGDAIRIIELEGYLYFGTADEFLLRTDILLREGARHIILDVHHLKSVDISGLVVVDQAHERCRDAGARLAIVSPVRSPLRGKSQLSGLVYDYLDDALAAAEDLLIDSAGESEHDTSITLAEVDILSEFTPAELTQLEPYLTFQSYSDGTKVLTEGEAGDSVFMIAAGRAELFTTTDGLYHCYYRLSRGTVFGEMAMIDGRPRSADVLAAGTLSCWVLTMERLNRLKQEHPDVAYRVMTGVAALLSRRIRINLNIISQYRK